MKHADDAGAAGKPYCVKIGMSVMVRFKVYGIDVEADGITGLRRVQGLGGVMCSADSGRKLMGMRTQSSQL